MQHLFTTSEAAQITGVSVGTIRVWHSRGRLPRYGSPGLALWRLADLTRIACGDAHAAPGLHGGRGRRR